MISAEKFRAACRKHHFASSWYGTDQVNTLRIAREFGVSQRTARRWANHGMPLLYGDPGKPSHVTPACWEHFEAKGTVDRRPGQQTGVDPQLSARSSRRTGLDRQMSARPGRPLGSTNLSARSSSRTGVKKRPHAARAATERAHR